METLIYSEQDMREVCDQRDALAAALRALVGAADALHGRTRADRDTPRIERADKFADAMDAARGALAKVHHEMG